VLIADDEESIRWVLKELITELGYEVEEAPNGNEARAALARRRFGHAFLDLNMPGGGPETVQEVAREHPDVMVVVATAFPAQAVRAATGPVVILPKPFEFNQVEAVLRMQMRPPAGSR
jgi:DNA-binding NtrC family response regulator